MDGVLIPVLIVGMLFIGLPWLIFHYVTKWKTAGTITNEDEDLLDDLHRMARRLDERMDTIERLVELENPEWKPSRLSDLSQEPRQSLENIEDRMEDRIKERRQS